jgi:hypothetical protein
MHVNGRVSDERDESRVLADTSLRLSRRGIASASGLHLAQLGDDGPGGPGQVYPRP